ncbi:hypothetical protein ACR3K2_38070 [Cryptosporidium serpentis]
MLFIILLWLFQEKLLFFPSKENECDLLFNTPKFQYARERGIYVEDIYIITQDNIKLHGWFMIHNKTNNNFNDNIQYNKAPEKMKYFFPIQADILNKSKKYPTIIYFHGNAGNIGNRLINYYEMYITLGVNIFAVSYRGYGICQGKPSELGLYKDSQAILDYIISRDDIVDINQIYLFGHSIGGAIAIDLAFKNPGKITGIIVENTFMNMNSIIFELFPLLSLQFIKPFLPFIQRLKFDSYYKISNIDIPILFITGLKDTLVSPNHTIKLYENAKKSKNKKVYKVIDGEHNNTWLIGGIKYYEALIKFIYLNNQYKEIIEQENNYLKKLNYNIRKRS